MKKKWLTFFSLVYVFSMSSFLASPKIQSLTQTNHQTETKQLRDLNNLNSFFDLMDTIKTENGANDQENQMLKYVSSTKTYYLKQDLDFQPLIDAGEASKLYDGSHDIELIENSVFNGNDHLIANRYDKTALQAFMQAKQTKFFDMFDKDTSLNRMYLFQNVNGASIFNLNFENSPFFASDIHAGNIHNISMNDIYLDDLEVDFNNTSNTNNRKVISIPLFFLSVGSGVNITNSTFDNINITNNTFDVTDNNNVINIAFSLNGRYFKTDDQTLNTTYSDIEMSNWTISGNKVLTHSWNASSFSQTSFMFSPFLINGATYTNVGWTKDSLSSTANSSLTFTPRSAYEASLFIKNIYMNDFYIANNTKSYGSNSTDAVNLTFYPFYNDDDILNVFYDTILLNNIRLENQSVISEFYKTISKNTIYVNNNLHYLDNVSDSLTSILNGWKADASSLISDQNYKATKFNSAFWNMEGDQLSLKTDYQVNFNNQIIYANDLPTINLNSQLNNFFPTVFNVELIKNNDTIKTYDLKNEIDSLTFANNINTQVDISDIFAEDFTYLDDVSLHIMLSEANPLLDFTVTFDTAANNSYVYNFQNTYNSDSNIFAYGFSLLDPFEQVGDWTINAYNKNKKLFTIESDSVTKITKNNTVTNISGQKNNVSLSNPDNLYFVFEMQINNRLTAIVPGNNFRLGESNYIDRFLSKPRTWMFYYWWVLLILLLLLIFVIMIIIGMVYAQKQKNKINQIETAMAIWAKDHDDSGAFSDYITDIALSEEGEEDGSGYDYGTDSDYDNSQDDFYEDLYLADDYLEEDVQQENYQEDDYLTDDMNDSFSEYDYEDDASFGGKNEN